jgi:hypothetical protein
MQMIPSADATGTSCLSGQYATKAPTPMCSNTQIQSGVALSTGEVVRYYDSTCCTTGMVSDGMMSGTISQDRANRAYLKGTDCMWTVGPSSTITVQLNVDTKSSHLNFVVIYSCMYANCTDNETISTISGFGNRELTYTINSGYMRIRWLISTDTSLTQGFSATWSVGTWSVNPCTNCVANSRSPVGSASVSDCTCDTGYTGPPGGPCVFGCSKNTQSTSSFTTTSTTNATGTFCGDKFVFKHTPGLLVCEAPVQVRAYSAFMQTQYSLNLSGVFVSSLTDTCVSKFGIRTSPFGLPPDVLRSSEVRLSGDCLFYAYSPTDVHCVRRAGGVQTLKFQTQGTIADVCVHENFLVRTVHDRVYVVGKAATYVLLLSAIGSASEIVLRVPGLIMFARGAPQFYLQRTSDYSLFLSRFTSVNTTFSLNSTSTYDTDKVCTFFSSDEVPIFPVPISSRNTVLEHASGAIVFATAKYTGQHVFVYVGAFDVASAMIDTYSMPFAVYDIDSNEPPTKIDDAYEQIAFAGEATISVTWMHDYLLLISVAIDNVVPTNYQTMLINIKNLQIIDNAMHPDLIRAFRAPFVRLSNAVVSQGALLSCSECQATTTGSDMSGFFAYGASFVSYRRLIKCEEYNRYIEHDMSERLPTETCARVSRIAATPHVLTTAVFEMTLRCVTMQSLEVIFERPAGSSVRFGATEYPATSFARLLLYAVCRDYAPLRMATVYDTTLCTAGCSVTLDDGRLFMSGGVRIASVRQQSDITPVCMIWNRLVLLYGGVPSSAHVQTDLTQDVWQEYSMITRRIVPRQPILIHTRRHVSVESIAILQGGDTEHGLALDALAVVPLLSEDLLWMVKGNTEVLMTIVYVPSRAQLLTLQLETLSYGDDVHDWERVHASVHVVATGVPRAECTYVARLVSVDADNRVLERTRTTGCVFEVPRAPQCHLELPRRLVNTASVVGLEIVPSISACDLLRDASLTVEFAPFMKMSRCPAQHFLDSTTLTCVPCDDGEPECRAGQFVRGCLALIHPNAGKECLPCAFPNNSAFPNTSRGCGTWQCHSGYYRQDGSCLACTTLLAQGAAACANTPGRRRVACSDFENEKCADCETKPWYSQWTLSGGQECTWRCQTGYFTSGAGCEKCSTLDEAVVTLGLSGMRQTGAFYRFRSCTGTQQALSEKCSARDFGYDLDGTYVSDGPAFDEDCVLQCVDNSNRHSVRINATRVDVGSISVWRARVCQTCAEDMWPTFANRTRLPRLAFDMSVSCVSTCLSSSGFFVTNDSHVCLWCPSAACANGTFWSAHDNCAACQACAQKRAGSVFISRGTFNDAHSCEEQCPHGFFSYDERTCKQHSVLACTDGVEYRIAGTSSSDAQCGTCADCSGAQEVVPCSLDRNRQCKSCGAIELWSSQWSRTGCNLTCHTSAGYTKLHRATGAVCRKCLPCELGYALPDTPVDCTCKSCTARIPAKAIYTKGCTWQCPLYHVARQDVMSGDLVCEYTVKQTSNGAYRLRSTSVVTCPPGQLLTTDVRPAAYASLQCETCNVPRGLDLAQLNILWTWDRECEWRCAWNTQKLQTLGMYRCETLHYAHVKTQVPAVFRAKQAVSWALVGGLVACAVVVIVFCLCFLGRMLRD